MKLGEKAVQSPTLNFILFGAPGAGKGTHAEIIAKRYHLNHISTGDLLRKEVAEGTELGMQVKAIMDRGDLVSDDIVSALIEKAIKTDTEGLILDGYPRTVQQADTLVKLFDKYGRKLSCVIRVDVEKEELVRRIHERSQVSNRSDDKEDAIRRRLEDYEEKTVPLLDYYKKAGILITVNGGGSIDETQAAIVEALIKHGNFSRETINQGQEVVRKQVREALARLEAIKKNVTVEDK